MSQLTLEIPDKIIEPFKIAAQRQHKQVEQLIIEQLAFISTTVSQLPPRLTEVEQLFRQSGLLVRTEPMEKQSEPPLSEAERERLAQKLSQAGPLSELIISEREEQL
ncbi:hypothetical protein FJZ31_22070 [Candidatus Poribacteria bacterium]|nr:hypothetical protein [Candidatus Poribacteria bacterium]